jgi:hypothetical protein
MAGLSFNTVNNPFILSTPSTFPTGVKINTNPDGTPIITAGQTTLDKLLATLTTNIAIIKGAGYIPTTQQQQPNYAQLPPDYYAQQLALQSQNNTGGQFGADIQKFIQNNGTLLAIAVVGIVLYKSGRK